MFDAAITHNAILSSLSAETYGEIRPKFEKFKLTFGNTLYEHGEIFTHVYFMESGIISMLAGDSERTTVEVAMVGHEGMVPTPLFLGIATSSCKLVVQGSGVALRMKADEFLTECSQREDLSLAVRLFTNSILDQIIRAAICNRFHNAEERLARWLLMTQDRMISDKFHITQEFLSYIVGVRREAVNKSAGKFARLGLISYHRGNMSIDDRQGLIKLACNCYGKTTSK